MYLKSGTEKLAEIKPPEKHVAKEEKAPPAKPSEEDYLKILKQRLAKGEIQDAEEGTKNVT